MAYLYSCLFNKFVICISPSEALLQASPSADMSLLLKGFAPVVTATKSGFPEGGLCKHAVDRAGVVLDIPPARHYVYRTKSTLTKAP